MTNAADVLRVKKEEYSKLMTLEMGKPIAQSRSEVEKCTWVCEYYAENAEKFLSDELIQTDASKSFVAFQPLGVVLAVMPWNFPIWPVFRFASPGLMAGNAGILKHASNVSGCGLAIEEVFREAGFPENLFRTILVPASEMQEVIKNENIKAVTLLTQMAILYTMARKQMCIRQTHLILIQMQTESMMGRKFRAIRPMCLHLIPTETCFTMVTRSIAIPTR